MSFLLSQPGKSACHFMFDCSSKSGSVLGGLEDVGVGGVASFVQHQHAANAPLALWWQGAGEMRSHASNYGVTNPPGQAPQREMHFCCEFENVSLVRKKINK